MSAQMSSHQAALNVNLRDVDELHGHVKLL